MAKAATTSDAPGASAESAAQSRTGAASTAPSAGPDAVGTSPVEVGKPVVVSDSTSAPEIPGRLQTVEKPRCVRLRHGEQGCDERGIGYRLHGQPVEDGQDSIVGRRELEHDARA